MSGRLDFDFGFSQPQANRQPTRSDQEPRRILVLGDLGGHATGSIAARPVHGVDLDTFDDVIARIAPRVSVEIGGAGVMGDLEIGSLESFHPDSLLGELPAFRSLLDLRKRLLDPTTFAAAAAELGAGPAPEEPTAAADSEDAANTLERLLGRPAGADSGSSSSPISSGSGTIDMSALIKDIIAPHIVPADDPRADACVATVDAAIADQLRATLHDPAFQALEATWRGIDWLRTELELGEELQLFVCDLTRDELLADLRRHADRLEESELFRLVYEHEAGTQGGRSWSLLLGDYAFDSNEDDVYLLAALGAIAARTGAPFLAGARPGVFGCDSAIEASDPAAWSTDESEHAQRWSALRRSPQAPWLGLALPRVLLRLPYGKRGDDVESVPFEELTADPVHESFLWGNAAYACALHLARESMGLAGTATVDGLPAATVLRGGQTMLQPCAEVLLSERVGRAMLDRGVIPLMSHRDRNAISILRVQSLADPSRPLEGW